MPPLNRVEENSTASVASLPPLFALFFINYYFSTRHVYGVGHYETRISRTCPSPDHTSSNDHLWTHHHRTDWSTQWSLFVVRSDKLTCPIDRSYLLILFLPLSHSSHTLPYMSSVSTPCTKLVFLLSIDLAYPSAKSPFVSWQPPTLANTFILVE